MSRWAFVVSMLTFGLVLMHHLDVIDAIRTACEG